MVAVEGARIFVPIKTGFSKLSLWGAVCSCLDVDHMFHLDRSETRGCQCRYATLIFCGVRFLDPVRSRKSQERKKKRVSKVRKATGRGDFTRWKTRRPEDSVKAEGALWRHNLLYTITVGALTPPKHSCTPTHPPHTHTRTCTQSQQLHVCKRTSNSFA